MNKISGVYLIRNTITNDCYVGSGVDVKRRWSDHRCPLYWKRYSNNPMYKDMQAIGKDKFSFEILEECDKSQLFIREQYYINKLKPIYNRNRAFRTSEEYKEQKNKLSKKWQQTHKKQRNESSKKWRAKHPDYMRQWRAKRKAESLKVEPTK